MARAGATHDRYMGCAHARADRPAGKSGCALVTVGPMCFWLPQLERHCLCMCHTAGAMGPIPAEHMAQWLLYGVPPRQLGRAVHRPLLEATAADPGSLLVCGLLPGEVERAMKPGAHGQGQLEAAMILHDHGCKQTHDAH